MKICADYHTHSTFSHGKGTVTENAFAAKEKGLEAIAISDHGFAHPFFGLKKSKTEALRAECARAEDATGVKVLVGVEANFTDKHGHCDLKEDLYDKFDVFLAGAHVCVRYSDFETAWNIGFYQPLAKRGGWKENQRARDFTTAMYLSAIENQPIDIITHLDFRVFSNVAEIARCCAKYGTYVEINTKKTHMTDKQWKEVAATGVNFVIGSDAHSPDRVGDDASAFELIERVGIDISRVHNVGRFPDFRFFRYKGERR